jgi:hypothetical protein
VNTGNVKAYKAGFSVDDGTGTEPTMDGKWTTNDEWTDSFKDQLYGGFDGIFRVKYASSYPDWVHQYFLIELFSDNTNDAGDYWQLCYASAAEFTFPDYSNPPGGTTPGTTCLRIDFVGHAQAGLTIYKGTGTGWGVLTGYTWPTNIQIVDSISASPSNSTPHWIVEIKVDHMYSGFGIAPNFWIRVAAYDASNSAAGVKAWPPESSVNVPDDWGLMTALQTAIPEGLTIGVMVLISSVAVIVSTRYFRKQPKI